MELWVAAAGAVAPKPLPPQGAGVGAHELVPGVTPVTVSANEVQPVFTSLWKIWRKVRASQLPWPQSIESQHGAAADWMHEPCATLLHWLSVTGPTAPRAPFAVAPKPLDSQALFAAAHALAAAVGP